MQNSVDLLCIGLQIGRILVECAVLVGKCVLLCRKVVESVDFCGIFRESIIFY